MQDVVGSTLRLMGHAVNSGRVDPASREVMEREKERLSRRALANRVGLRTATRRHRSPSRARARENALRAFVRKRGMDTGEITVCKLPLAPRTPRGFAHPAPVNWSP